MTKCVYVNNIVLRWARETAGYSLEDISSAYKKILNWEAGEDFPTYKQLEDLSKKYKRPLAVFFFSNPPEEEPVKKSFRTIPDYELENLNPDLIKIFKKAQLMQINLREINNNTNPSLKNIIKNLKIDKGHLEKSLDLVREFLNFPLEEQKKCKTTTEAFECWRSVFADCGIFVFKEAFKNENVSGFCLYDEEFPVIFVNNSVSKSRQIFTLFHELAHLLIRNNHIDLDNLSYLDKLNNEDRLVEIVCNKFAGEFLVPKSDFLQKVKNKQIDDKLIINLANIYSVSQEVILRKLLDQKLISNQAYAEKAYNLNKEFEEHKNRTSGGNYYYTQIAYLGSQYLNLVFEKYNLNLIPFAKAVEYTGIKADSFNKLESCFYGLRRQ